MVILVYDSSGKAADGLHGILKAGYGEDNVHYFTDRAKLMHYADRHIFHVVFLCLSVQAEEELDDAGRLCLIIPGVNLIIISEDERYMSRALKLHASGYICLPLTEEAVDSELHNLLYPVYDDLPLLRLERRNGITVFIDEKPVSFAYKKTGELLALLFDMEGGMLSNEVMIDRLWEESKDIDKSRSYLQNVRSDLIHTLSAWGLQGAVKHKRGRMWLDMSRFRVSEGAPT